MAEQPSAGALSAAFPAPPPFYKSFTPENLARIEKIRASSSSSTQTDHPAKSPPPLDIASLPTELRYLIPPQPPKDQYTSFNALHSINASEPTSTTPDPQRLKTLTRSLLLHFLSLTHILATKPADYARKWDELRDIFLQAHRVINEYRPHQARETLIQMMEEQVRRGREEIQTCRETGERVKEALITLGEEALKQVDQEMMVEKRKWEAEAEDKRLWKTLKREIGRF
ncbi:MAG: hypothetical protein Q9191_002895 [Dirinaria sp. TL-2023a]